MLFSLASPSLDSRCEASLGGRGRGRPACVERSISVYLTPRDVAAPAGRAKHTAAKSARVDEPSLASGSTYRYAVARVSQQTITQKRTDGSTPASPSAAYHSANFAFAGSYFDQGFLLPVKW